jgi:hypothetical protein
MEGHKKKVKGFSKKDKNWPAQLEEKPYLEPGPRLAQHAGFGGAPLLSRPVFSGA